MRTEWEGAEESLYIKRFIQKESGGNSDVGWGAYRVGICEDAGELEEKWAVPNERNTG